MRENVQPVPSVGKHVTGAKCGKACNGAKCGKARETKSGFGPDCLKKIIFTLIGFKVYYKSSGAHYLKSFESS